MTVPLEEILEKMSPKRRARIKQLTAEMLLETAAEKPVALKEQASYVKPFDKSLTACTCPPGKVGSEMDCPVHAIIAKTHEKMDAVNHPYHYTFGKYEVIDVLQDWFPDIPILWQVGKYIARAQHKGNMLQDLKKAQFYLNRQIAELEK